MRVLNSSFGFTVKVGEEHFGGHFNYHQNGVELVKMTFRRLPKKKSNGFIYEQVNYFCKVKGKWILWDVTSKCPKSKSKDDQATYAVFREAFGLSLLAEAG